MQRIQLAIGLPLALAFAGAASAQVTIVSVARTTHVGACVHVPPDNSNWCQSYDASNASTGPWGSGGSFGPGASNNTGYANAAVGSGQSSDISTTRIDYNDQSTAWAQSGGSCSSEAVGTSSLVVRFTVVSPTIAQVSGGVLNIGGSATCTISHFNGATVFSSTDSSFHTLATLPPGDYELRAGSITNTACSGNCEHDLIVRVNLGVDFSPAPCAADFDDDGTADFFDYDAFVICFEGGNCPSGKTADFDGDGSVDFFDYDAFVVAFEAGC